jgi:hypothetical protein
LTALATVLALLSAATFAISTSVQHQVAGTAPESARGPVGLIVHLFSRPWWVIGQVFAVVGFGLHAMALHYGQIAVVQPIVISGIVFAVPARAAISRRLPSRSEVQAVSLTALGLAVFLVASNPTPGLDSGLGARAFVLSGAGVAAAVLAAMVARGSARASRRAFLLGVTSGVLFGLVAGLLKMSLQELAAGGVVRMLTVWPTWAMVVVGGAGVVTNQVAYRIARLSTSMPVLNIVDGLVALTFGFFVFQEVPRHSPLFILIQVAALACVAMGLWVVARLEDEPVEHEIERVRSHR